MDENLMDEKIVFTVLDENDNEVECQMLLNFENQETGKHYIIYTDNTRDGEGNVNIYASIYDPDQENSNLESIETEEEWKMIEKVLDEMMSNVVDEILQPDTEKMN
ncbi:MAG: DUF1292 domain-containing protein [Clostridiales bacterium]